MKNPPNIFHGDEAKRFIDTIADPVTKNLVNLAFVHFISKMVHTKRAQPEAPLDLLFLVTTLSEFFSEKEVLHRALEGENVGAMFEENLELAHSSGTKMDPFKQVSMQSAS